MLVVAGGHAHCVCRLQVRLLLSCTTAQTECATPCCTHHTRPLGVLTVLQSKLTHLPNMALRCLRQATLLCRMLGLPRDRHTSGFLRRLCVADMAFHSRSHSPCCRPRDGAAEAALAGGVLLTLVPQSTLMLAAAGMMAPDGRCKTLDAAADGYVRAEACRILLLQNPSALHHEFVRTSAATAQVAQAGTSDLQPSKRSQEGTIRTEGQPGPNLDPDCTKQLSLGQPDGKHPQMERARAPVAVLLGCGVNTNGRASALTAPHGPSQQALLRTVLEAAAVAAAEVAGLQLHANGTPLGDPIELGAGAAVFQASLSSPATSQIQS